MVPTEVPAVELLVVTEVHLHLVLLLEDCQQYSECYQCFETDCHSGTCYHPSGLQLEC